MEYTTVKFIHLLGAVLFLGNIIVTAVWKSLADRTRNPVIIAFACRLVNVTDLAFTAFGAALVVIGGVGLFHAGGISLSDSPHLTIWHQSVCHGGNPLAGRAFALATIYVADCRQDGGGG